MFFLNSGTVQATLSACCLVTLHQTLSHKNSCVHDPPFESFSWCLAARISWSNIFPHVFDNRQKLSVFALRLLLLLLQGKWWRMSAASNCCQRLPGGWRWTGRGRMWDWGRRCVAGFTLQQGPRGLWIARSHRSGRARAARLDDDVVVLAAHIHFALCIVKFMPKMSGANESFNQQNPSWIKLCISDWLKISSIYTRNFAMQPFQILCESILSALSFVLVQC